MRRFFTAAHIAWMTVPKLDWWKYATMRTGAFVLSYFCINAAIILTLTLLGFTLGITAIFGIVPLTVFLAIRVSGAIAEKYKDI